MSVQATMTTPAPPGCAAPQFSNQHNFQYCQHGLHDHHLPQPLSQARPAFPHFGLEPDIHWRRSKHPGHPSNINIWVQLWEGVLMVFYPSTFPLDHQYGLDHHDHQHHLHLKRSCRVWEGDDTSKSLGGAPSLPTTVSSCSCSWYSCSCCCSCCCCWASTGASLALTQCLMVLNVSTFQIHEIAPQSTWISRLSWLVATQGMSTHDKELNQILRWSIFYCRHWLWQLPAIQGHDNAVIRVAGLHVRLPDSWEVGHLGSGMSTTRYFLILVSTIKLEILVSTIFTSTDVS